MNKLLCLLALFLMVSCHSVNKSDFANDIDIHIVLKKIVTNTSKDTGIANMSISAVNKTVRHIAVSDKIGFLSCNYTAKGDFFSTLLPLDMPRSQNEKFKVLNPNPHYKPNELPSDCMVSYDIKLPMPEDRTMEDLKKGQYKFKIGIRFFDNTIKTVSIEKNITSKQFFRFIDARKRYYSG